MLQSFDPLMMDFGRDIIVNRSSCVCFVDEQQNLRHSFRLV